MDKNEKKIIIEELVKLIETGNAHVSLNETVADLPAKLRTEIPGDLPYSIWQLIEHIRIAQWDIVEFSLSSAHKSPKWPDEYWVSNPESVDDVSWQKSISAIEEDRQRFFKLLQDPSTDLYSKIPHGDGQTIFREALLIADHTSYHLGEILVLRRLLKSWK